MSEIYERKAEYWVRDLADRDFEQRVMAGLAALGWEYQDNTAAHDRPDLYLYRRVRGRRTRLALELKEKRQPYRPRWAELAALPESELLVVDEVALRKLLAWAPRAVLLFQDLATSKEPYVLYTIIDLFCLPKTRVRRSISLQTRQMKAKWLLNRRHGRAFADLNAVYAGLANYMDRDLWQDLRALDIHGGFAGEIVETL